MEPQDRRTPLPVRGAVARGAGKRAVDPYRLIFPGEDWLDLALQETTGLLRNRVRVHGSTGKEGFQLAGHRRRQFRFQEIKHYEHRLLGVLPGDPCSLYNQVYYLFVHSELSARA